MTKTLLIGSVPSKLHVRLQLFLFSTSNFSSKNKWYRKLKGRISLHIETSGLWATAGDEITYWRKRHPTHETPRALKNGRGKVSEYENKNSSLQGKLFLRFSSPFYLVQNTYVYQLQQYWKPILMPMILTH